LVNAQVAASLIAAHHADVHLATALTAHRATTALPIAKQHKMHVMTHAASLRQHHTVL
jgi:tRNA threonylcarbamoyladenosine modification (KEOPS) complex Cgi121 subunit